MKWVIVRRVRIPVGKTHLNREIMLNSKGEFDYYSQDAAVFPSMEQAQFVANGFELGLNTTYIVKPYEEPE